MEIVDKIKNKTKKEIRLEAQDEVIKELSEMEIANKCIWVNQLEKTLEALEINSVVKELIDNIIKEYREIATISMSKSLTSTREQSNTLKDLMEIKKDKLELEAIVLTNILASSEPTILN